MPILRRVPWTKQPQVAVEIDWSNPITRGLVLASSHATNLRNVAASTSNPTLINSPSSIIYGAGRAFKFAEGATQGIDYGNSALLNPQAFTLFSQFQINAALTTTNEYMLISRDDASLGRAYVLSVNGSENWGVRAYINGGGVSTLAEGTLPSVGVPHTAAYTLTSGNVRLYRDGFKVASATGAGSVATTTGNTQIGKRTYSGYPSAMSGYIGLSLIFNRALSDDEIKTLSDNPWQIFKPLPCKLFVKFESSGPVDHTTGGDLVGNAATVTGSAELIEPITIHQATGTVVGGTGTVAGTSRRFRAHSALGTLLGDLASVTGAAELVEPVNIHQAFGDVVGFNPSVSGVANRTHVHPATGIVVGSTGTVVGQSQIDSPPGVHECSGVLTGQLGTVTGAAIHLKRHTTTGSVVGRTSTVVGEAVKKATHTSSGAPIGYDSTVTGSATVSGQMTLTPADINAIVDALVARILPVNIIQVNNVTVDGTGAPGNEWGPM